MATSTSSSSAARSEGEEEEKEREENKEEAETFLRKGRRKMSLVVSNCRWPRWAGS